MLFNCSLLKRSNCTTEKVIKISSTLQPACMITALRQVNLMIIPLSQVSPWMQDFYLWWSVLHWISDPTSLLCSPALPRAGIHFSGCSLIFISVCKIRFNPLQYSLLNWFHGFLGHDQNWWRNVSVSWWRHRRTHLVVTNRMNKLIQCALSNRTITRHSLLNKSRHTLSLWLKHTISLVIKPWDYIMCWQRVTGVWKNHVWGPGGSV